MKLIDLQSFNTESEYRSSYWLNYSKLKAMSTDPTTLISDKKIDVDKSPGIRFGKLVDTMLTDYENMDNEFYIGLENKPTASSLTLANAFLEDELINSGMCDDEKHRTYEISLELGLWSKVKDAEKVIAKFDNDVFWNYIKFKRDSKGKTVITNAEYKNAERCCDLLSNHEYTKSIISRKNSERFEVIDQFKYKFYYNNTKCKAMFDKIIVDHEEEIIYPYDIKTGFDRADRFPNAFRQFRYDIQASLYTEGLRYLALTNEAFSNYSIAPFKFIYASSSEENYPLIYTTTEDVHAKSLSGWKTNGGYKFKGVDELIEEYNWREMSGVYDRSMTIVKNGGILELKL